MSGDGLCLIDTFCAGSRCLFFPRDSRKDERKIEKYERGTAEHAFLSSPGADYAVELV